MFSLCINAKRIVGQMGYLSKFELKSELAMDRKNEGFSGENS